jgi:HNH endonuclease/AP2 domain
MKKLKSVNGIPLSYIKSIVKIDSSSPSGLTWLSRDDKKWSFKFANQTVGSKHANKCGYEKWTTIIYYNSKACNLKCSRIIFLLHKGYLTKDKIIDHIDNNSLNNKIENLREGTRSQNQHNSKLPKNNTSGYKGVIFHKASGKWRVRIKMHGKEHYFGMYVNKEDAIKVAIAARKKLHGEFGRDK